MAKLTPIHFKRHFPWVLLANILNLGAKIDGSPNEAYAGQPIDMWGEVGEFIVSCDTLRHVDEALHECGLAEQGRQHPLQRIKLGEYTLSIRRVEVG